MVPGDIGIRGKLILIFVLIKVLPLVALAWFAWDQMAGLGRTVAVRTAQLSEQTQTMVGEVGSLATEDSIRALDRKARETIERLTTDTARQVASFLYDRDRDIIQAAFQPTNAASYERFLKPLTRPVTLHQPWILDDKTDTWVAELKPPLSTFDVVANNKDNAKNFHSRPPEHQGVSQMRPLYHEMTFVDLNGLETIKVSMADLLPGGLTNVSAKGNTYCRAETYFEALKKLKPGEIYVSEVIGPYVPGHIIGPYTRAKAAKAGIPFEPQKSGYGGKENPKGKRFQGIIRWATPVQRNGKTVGWVTLALDHTHVMEFTDHVIPTAERYSPISDAATGNYAFMWDYKGRNISHPRDYFIVGRDPQTGEQAVPWMTAESYESFKASGLTFSEFAKTAPAFHEQSLEKKPSVELIKQGLIALDGRFLDFAPQCSGWHNLTQNGGSGSFVIFWSGLWKLTTAASIPYHTGIYGDHPRGFGYVTIGANVNEFHRAATETAEKIDTMVTGYESELEAQNKETQTTLAATLKTTAQNLTFSTMLMIFVVILIAIWMASTLTRKITSMIATVRRFQKGDLDARLNAESTDEIGQLALAFNEMSDSIKNAFHDLSQAESKYRNIVEHAAAGIFQSTIEGRFINVNPALARMMGYDSPNQMIAEITDLGSQFYCGANTRQTLLDNLNKQNMVEETEFQAFRRDGSKGWFTSNTRLVRDDDGNILYIEGMILNITDSKDKELAQRERNMAEAASLAKSEFLARMSHEIRTPMNAVIGVADLLSEYKLNHEQEILVRLLKSSGDNLLSLIDDILDLSKIEAGKIILDESTFDLHEEIATLCSLLAHSAFEKNLQLEYHISPAIPRQISGDQARLRQILTNLIGNAIKFTTKGEIMLSVSALKADEDSMRMVFTVSDTGIGIPRDKLEQVFESFGQVDSSITRSFGGTGLGLAICKRLVEIMNGTISVSSTLGKGSDFSFTLTLPTVRDALAPTASIDLDLENLKILVATDHAPGRTRLAHVLRHHKADVTEAKSDKEALLAANNLAKSDLSFDLALVDVHLSDMAGFELADKLISEEKMGGRVFMLVTANSLLKDEMRLKELDLAGYLVKPVNERLLISTLNKLLRKGPEKPRQPETAPTKPSRRKKLLVVDDAKDNRLIMEQHLKRTPYDFDMAENGEEALELLENETYDLVFMDMQMPVMDGYKSTAKLREMEAKQERERVIVVALTAHTLTGDQNKCLEAGCDDYLPKPVRKAELLDVLGRYLETD